MNRSTEHWAPYKKAVASHDGVVASQHMLASRAGASMLHAGGNAIDAAVATAFALAAVEPWMCGLGGSGYLVVWHAATKTAHTFDFQGMLPEKISGDDYPLDPDVPASIMGFPGVADRRNVVGYGSVTVPGAAKGLARALQKFGRLGLDSALKPAISLAEAGLPCTWFTTLQIALAAGDLLKDPAAAGIYMRGGVPPQPEQLLAMGALPDTLRALADQGPDTMYGGALGQRMCADLQAGGSRITLEDFAAYEVLEDEALTGTHRGAQLHTAGPTSGGPRLIDTLAHIQANLDRQTGIGAASWKVYADGLNKAWRKHNARIGRTTEVGGCTSSMSAVDTQGNMVAITYTLLNRFGARVVLPATGILMNNSVSYFDPRPGYPTTMSPRKRINASNMCPTVATRDGESIFAVGASGANYIMPCTTQLAALMLDFDLTLEQAFNQPRIDASDRGSIRVDPRVGEDVLAALGKDFELEVAQLLVFPKLYACPSGVSRDPATGLLHGINDPSQPIGGAACAQTFEVDNLVREEGERP